MIKAVFFDMNETLLNLSLLQAQFDKHFNDKYVLKYWFTKLLYSSSIMGIMGEYRNFGELADIALENLFFENNKPLTAKTKSQILGEFKRLPAYDDVLPALNLLKKENIRVVAVSNSSLEMMKEQLTNSGIIDKIDSYYSVDSIKKYKPFKDIYQSSAKEEGLELQDIIMIATHDWDLFGAKKAGLKTAYIQRKEEIYHPYYLQPDFKDANLQDLVLQIIESENN
ncbi:haloacid dehalogenase, type II [Polaribacter reichenbachii]|uniref:Haloacid dehalogenase n=1 Tax=Polaribacter reichenbachii TaxID=996801 RepID=A0A1B8U488_9FLAO|nr:haloacid dehalogenase type II [Polaribacter reichenbachii]APZ47418.1 haloacid dehalogenase, type II [Polaribacter reichenbachii]AUC18057.1 haloacid dehalogenase, type II [Polaribacter reichenbachii]OBY66667.1 haloacid dehalogenase [Polaribacter reichenbachii]